MTSRSLPGERTSQDGGGRTEKEEWHQQWAEFLGEWEWGAFYTLTFERAELDENGRYRPITRTGLVDPGVGHTVVGWSKSDRLFREWMGTIEERAGLNRAYWFRAREPNKGHPGTHFHGLLGGVGNLSRTDMWRAWHGPNGMARIEPIQRVGGVAAYVSKYVTKDGGEFVFSPNLGLYKTTETVRDGNTDVPFGWRSAGW